MRELLIRYILGEMDAEERQEVQSQLQTSPELRRELARLRECFAAQQDADSMDDGPPSDLAARTAERVTGCCDSNEPVGRREAAFTEAGDAPPAGILGWSLADLTVAGGVMLAVSMLIFPALRNSRDGTRRQVCQNNQRQLWVLVTKFAEDHGGEYPRVEPNENAGIFVARLIERGYVHPEDLRVLLVCPAAPLADEIRSGRLVFRLPSAAAIRAMSASQVARATAKMSPFYAYRFPYRVGNEFRYVRDEHAPVFSDTSGDEGSDLMSPNHGGAFVQVLRQDGSLKVLTTCKLPGSDDDMFRNDRGVVAAGMRQQDTVLGRSEASPGDEFVTPDK